jgi:hypothetical protein
MEGGVDEMVRGRGREKKNQRNKTNEWKKRMGMMNEGQ